MIKLIIFGTTLVLTGLMGINSVLLKKPVAVRVKRNR